ncbi:protein ABHD18 [Diaphorina citri]|uniref:Protein ABHD18 n=1 Tax=Diaphorina citri TaxID=121845 RepID=A0A3Q0J405_DIACI|nr:protein ABHD18 [Diaphorina citri]
MTINRIDHLYRSILLSKYFVKGWGKPENFKQLFEFRKRVCNRESCYKLVSKDYPVTVHKKEETNEYKLLEGHFVSPFGQYLPDLVPEESKTAFFQVLIPKSWDVDSSGFRPMVLHMAGTGDHYFWRRRNLIAKPLLKESNIGSIILENPFYGTRKPESQVYMLSLIMLGNYIQTESETMTITCAYKPRDNEISSPSNSQSNSGAVPWDLLEDQYNREHTFRDEIEKMMTIIDGEAYKAGEHFARTYPSSLLNMGAMSSSNNTSTHLEDVMTSQERDNLLTKIQIKLGHLTDRSAISKPASKLLPCRYRLSCQLHRVSISLQMASLAATNWPKPLVLVPWSVEWGSNWPKPLVLVPCLSWSTASGVFTEGVLSGAVPWDLLEDQYNREHTFRDEIEKMMTIIDGEAYKAGEHFARTYPSSLLNMGAMSSSNNTSTHLEDVMTSQERDNLLTKIQIKLGHLTDRSAISKPALDVKVRQGFHFMRGIMNQCTHLANFSTPIDTSLIIAVCARDDGYVPQEGVMDLRDIWPGCEVRYVEGGHVLAFLLHQQDFRNAIRDAFNRARLKMNQKPQLKQVL